MLKSCSESGSHIKETLGLDNQVPAWKKATAWIDAAFVATGLIAGTAIYLKVVNQIDVGTELPGTVKAVLVTTTTV